MIVERSPGLVGSSVTSNCTLTVLSFPFQTDLMTEVEVQANLEEFIQTGRTGRRNAVSNILADPHAQLGTGGLAIDLEKLKCSGELTSIYKYPPTPFLTPVIHSSSVRGEGTGSVDCEKLKCSGELTSIYKYPTPTPFLTPVIHSSSVRGGGTGSVDCEKLKCSGELTLIYKYPPPPF